MLPIADGFTQVAFEGTIAIPPWVIPPEPFQKAAQESADPDRVAQYLGEFCYRHPTIADRLKQDPQRLRWLGLVSLQTRFLSEELLRHPAWIFQISQIDAPSSVADYRQRLSASAGISGQTPLSLAVFRRKELLRILIRDGLGLSSLSDITEEISNLADAILAPDARLRRCIRHPTRP